ncbi:DUF2827 domain-containing protein [Dyella japonica]|uniref:DUF2827 domain-containing protein n=1 Tax=Dyella japonica A8 TaxID=1217721 RepID=A0A075JXC1_9GAMM|nr:DUF2827 domain-containing protein [Dyella japonica]AIF46107.1 hypothetical protein HY57_01945 [Dyella japonica A8]
MTKAPSLKEGQLGRKINVGISVFAVQGAELWSSGLNQNLAFLVTLLRDSERVGRIVLLNGGDQPRLPAGLNFDLLDTPLVAPSEVTHELDLVIEMGAQLPLEWLRHVRALGTKIVTFFVGHTFADLAESPLFGKEAGHIFNGTPWHEVWTLPHHMKTSGPLLKTVTRVPVHAVPHIWAPTFIQKRLQGLGEVGRSFGFRPRQPGAVRHGWRAAIFEPNISVVKNSVLPMLVCEKAYRSKPESIALMMVMNSYHMKEHYTFNRFASNLDLTRNSHASYEPRLDFADCMTRYAMDVVVSHHWECDMNYLYYDALYGGYPLVHNSQFLRGHGAGLYYPDFDAATGGACLIEAWEKDADYWSDYAACARRLLARLSPGHPDNISEFVHRIEMLVDNVVSE